MTIRVLPSRARLCSPRILSIVPFYYGWVIVALSFLANLTAAGIRSAPSLLIHPLEAEFGWNRTAIASAVSLNLYFWIVCAGRRLVNRPHRPAPRDSFLPGDDYRAFSMVL
jgi:hypothetical protein